MHAPARLAAIPPRVPSSHSHPSMTALAHLADILDKGPDAFLPPPAARQQPRTAVHTPAAVDPIDAIEAACSRVLRTLLRSGRPHAATRGVVLLRE